MSQKISRRNIVRGAAIAAVSTALPLSGAAQSPNDDAELDKRVGELEKGLSKPLSPEAKKIAKTMVKWVDDLTTNRMKQKLPENSEPCFTYIPTAVKK